jgi:hypothetical protein
MEKRKDLDTVFGPQEDVSGINDNPTPQPLEPDHSPQPFT